MPSSTTIARGNVQLEAILQIQAAYPALGTGTSSTAEVTVTVPGVQTGDFIEINKPSHAGGVSVGNIRASATNTVAIQFVNSTGASVAAGPTENYIIVVSRFDSAPATPPAAIA
jgi:hypothetical protein